MGELSLIAVSDRQQKSAVIDEDHLARMTLGDESLEREVLRIFARQTILMLARIADAGPACAAAGAHTLKGSALGIGSWRVAEAAGRVEEAVARDDLHGFKAAIAKLEVACSEVRMAIHERYGEAAEADSLSGGAFAH